MKKELNKEITKELNFKRNYGFMQYPGGKYYAVRILQKYFPRKFNTLISPFVGGGALELNMYHNKRCDKLILNDIFEPLMNTWRCCVEDTNKVFRYYNKYNVHLPTSKNHKHSEYEIFDKTLNRFLRAGIYYWHSMYNYPTRRHGAFANSRIVKQSNLTAHKRLLKYVNKQNIITHNSDYKEFLNKYKDGLTYLDPPYYSAGNTFYGELFEKNKITKRFENDFNHRELSNILRNRKSWILSYDNEPYIKDLYKDFSNIYYDSWIYSNRPGGDRYNHIELVITSKDIKPIKKKPLLFNNVKRVKLN